MKRFSEIFRNLVLPIIIIITVIAVCAIFLMNNLPFNDSHLDVTLNDEKIVLNNSLLLTDTMGKNLNLDNLKVGTTGYTEFEIKSKVDEKIKFEVYLLKEEAEPEIPLQFIKVYLTDENDNVIDTFAGSSVPTFYDLKVSDINLNGKILYSGSLKNKESKKFKLRMWVADTYEITPSENIFSVKLKVGVK